MEADDYESSQNLTNEQRFLMLYETDLVQKSRFLFEIYTHAETPIISMGAIGHLLTLFILFKSRHMQTTSFFYHKTLTMAELLYCFNCFLQKAIDHQYGVKNKQQTYSNLPAAFCSAVLSRVFSSVAGYVILYMTLLVACDRFLALYLVGRYRIFNRRNIAGTNIAVTTFLAIFLNSWSTALENVIEVRHQLVPKPVDQYRLITNEVNATLVDPLDTDYSIETVYMSVTRSSPEIYLRLLNVKNIYNGVLRIAYPIVLCGLTVAVIYGFVSHRRKRKQLSKQSMKYSSRDRNLFYLLLLMVLLVCLQVVPSEAKRILELLHPVAVLQQSISDESLSLEQRRTNMDIIIMGHLWGKLVANLCTFLNRSLSFYLYFCFNSTFRHETICLLKTIAALGRKRSNSDNSNSRTFHSRCVASRHCQYDHAVTV